MHVCLQTSTSRGRRPLKERCKDNAARFPCKMCLVSEQQGENGDIVSSFRRLCGASFHKHRPLRVYLHCLQGVLMHNNAGACAFMYVVSMCVQSLKL